MNTLHMNLAQAPMLARRAPDALEFPPALSQFLEEFAQVVKGALVRVAPAADLGPALRRDLGLD